MSMQQHRDNYKGIAARERISKAFVKLILDNRPQRKAATYTEPD